MILELEKNDNDSLNKIDALMYWRRKGEKGSKLNLNYSIL